MSVKRRRTPAGWRRAHRGCRGLPAWLQMKLPLSLERETSLLSGWGLGKLGLLVELVGRAGDRRGCPTLHPAGLAENTRDSRGVSAGLGGGGGHCWVGVVALILCCSSFQPRCFFFLLNHFFFHVFPREERSQGNKIQRLSVTYVLPGVGLECALILLVLYLLWE